MLRRLRAIEWARRTLQSQKTAARRRIRRETAEQLEDRTLLSNVHIDFSGVFNQDSIRNRTGGADDLADTSIDGSSRLVTDTYALNQSASGDGLPDNAEFNGNAFHPNVTLGYRNSDNGSNIVFLPGQNDAVTVQVPNGTYDTLHVFALSTSGATGMSVALNYSDGTVTRSTTVEDWFTEIIDGTTSGDAVRYELIDGMDRHDGVFDNVDDPAVFGHQFDVDQTRVLQSITITNTTASGSNLVVLGATADATSIIVDSTEGGSDGNFAPGDTSLREAIEITNANAQGAPDVITFAVNGTITVTSQLTINDDVTINGPGANALAISGGNNATRVFNVNNGNAGLIDVAISGLTIRDGGDGVANIRGAGVFNAENLTLDRVAVTGNNNGPGEVGGGIHSDGTMVLSNSTVAGNTSLQGGGLSIGGSTLIYNTTVSGNTATGLGGGITVVSGPVTIRNSTFTGNRSDADDAGGDQGGGVFANVGTTTLHNTLVAGNFRGTGTTPDDIGNTVSGTFNLIGDAGTSGGLTHGVGGNIVGNSGAGTLNTATVLNTTLASNGGTTQTHALVTGSPAIDAGSNAQALDENTAPLTTDQRQSPFVRQFNGITDIGAFESQTFIYIVDNTGDVNDGNTSTGQTTLREAILAANANPGSDTIDVQVGPITLTGELPFVTEDVTITSTAVSLPVIQGTGTDRIMSVQAVNPSDPINLTIDRLQLTGGMTTSNGGAIFFNTGTLTVTNSQIVSNTANGGGGIFMGNGTINVMNSNISGNASTAAGGGICVFAGSVNVTDSAFAGNTAATSGGAVSISRGGGLTGNNATFEGNTAANGNGGGIHLPNEATPVATPLTLTNSTVSGNTVSNGSGGGIFVQHGTSSTITDSVITGNMTATSNGGGGIATSGSAVLGILDSQISGNTTDLHGGGIRLLGTSSVTISNSTLSGNTAAMDGAAIDHVGAALTVRNSTITGNRADSDDTGADAGGAIYFAGVPFTAHNTIIGGNFFGTGTTPLDLVGVANAASSFNLIGDANTSGGITHGNNGNIVGNAGTGTLDISTVLNTTLADNGGSTMTHALTAASPAIDAGSNAQALDPNGAALTTDQRQSPFVRQFNGTTDIGAFESQSLSLTVDNTGDTNDGNFGANELTLREANALSNANPGADTIGFSVTGTIPVTSGQLQFTGPITINGPGSAQLTLDAQGANRVLHFQDSATISGLTITGGADTHGAGVLADGIGTFSGTDLTIDSNNGSAGNTNGGGGLWTGVPLTLSNSVISNNSDPDGGGGVVAIGATTNISNTQFTGNTATGAGGSFERGGGLWLQNTATVSGSTFSSNSSAQGGGAIYVFNGTATISDTTVTGNSTVQGGAAILTNTGAAVVVKDSTLTNNTATTGGGLFNNGTATIVNTTISGNTASDFGGGIWNLNGASLQVTNSTIVFNRGNSDDSGAGVGGGFSSFNAPATFDNTIFAGNVRGSGAGVPDDITGDGGTPVDTANSSNNLIADSGSAGGLTHGTNGNIVGNSGAGSLDPATIVATTLADNGGPTQTHSLPAGSPAIDAGNNSQAIDENLVALVFDQRQTPFSRFNDTVDIGSFEAEVQNPQTYIVDSNTDISDGDFSTGNFSLREAIEQANATSAADTILFNPLMSGSTITLGGTQLLITSSVTIGGLGAQSLTISANNASSVFQIDNSDASLLDVSISGVTITQALAGGLGGGINNFENLTLREVVVTNNTSTGAGGGVDHSNNGTLNIIASTISNNTGVQGAGIEILGGTVNIINSTVSGNTATAAGGGITVVAGTVTIRNTTITGNRADSDNTGGLTGGGIFANAGTTTIFNTIVAGNFRGAGVTPDDAGGVLSAGSAFNIIGDSNTSAGLTNSTNGNLVGNNGTGTLTTSTVLNTTLALTGGQTPVHSIPDGSPAVNAGSNALAQDENGASLTNDQRGPSHPRFSGFVEIGAFEKLLGAFGDNAVTTTNTPVEINVLANDTPATNTEIFQIPTGPQSGSVDFNGTATYTPNNAFTGADFFTYQMGLQQVKNGPGDVGANSEFGHSVAIDGDWMVVGSLSDDSVATDAGTAIVYRRTGGTWTMFQTINSPDLAATDRYGYAVAISGHTIVVSARMDDDSGFNSGSAYVWEFDASQNQWVNTTKLLDPQGQAKDQFGHSVAVEGDTIVIGARLGDGQGTNSGTVLIYERSTTGWPLTIRIKADDAQGGDQFGFAVAISGDTVAVTSRKDDDPGRDGGSAYILERNQGGANNWGQVTKILASTGVVNDWFGQSADIDGDTAVFGKPIRNGRRRPGQIHVYERNQGGANAWGEVTIVQDSNTTPDQDQFGYSVSISGNRLLGGSRRDDTFAGNAGAAYLFSRNSGGSNNWGQIDIFVANDPGQGDNAGSSVALDGNTVAFGAPTDDGGGSNAGALYVEDLRDKTATVNVQVNAPLQSASGVGSGAQSLLTQPVLDQFVDQAVALWQSTGELTPSQLARLAATSVTTDALDGTLLGYESGGTVVIDTDAAGYGWSSLSETGSGMDLLTVVTHELGHVLGLADTYDSADANNIMFGLLGVGETRALESALDLVFQDVLEDDELFGP